MYWITQSNEDQKKISANKKILVQINQVSGRLKSLQRSIDKSNNDANELKIVLKDSVKNLDDSKKLNSVQKLDDQSGKIAILVFSCNRPEAIKKHLDQLISIRKATVDEDKFPIIVSQDCGDEATKNAIETYRSYLYDSIKQPDLSDITIDKKNNNKQIPRHMRGYYKIARHYKWALDQIFMKHKFQTVILNEDDLSLSPDFLSYFEAMQKVLSNDSSLFCVSAWNDNGKKNLIDTKAFDKVHRSDFFPGLGWMMQRSLWLEMRKKWPVGFWDDWIREPVNRKNRACLRPEISRTELSRQESKKGVSMGQFFDKFLRLIEMNNEPVKWTKIDTSYLKKENYDAEFLNNVYNLSHEISFSDFIKRQKNSKNDKFLIIYSSQSEFVKYANHFGLMNDFKANVPRTAYLGIVEFVYKTKTIYLAPKEKSKWTSYNK